MYKQNVGLIFRSVLAGLLAVLFMAPGVYAQEEEDTDTFTLEEIMVTAEKREANLQKVPISIQTVSGVELTTEAKQRIDDIMRGVVGVASQDSMVGTDFYIRGLGTPDAGPPVGGLNQSAVAVLIDGVYQIRSEVVRGGTVDMAQAEVMRGTQSTTLGGSSLAGAVSLVSNDPVFEYEGSGSVGFGNYNLQTTQGVLNVPLSDNQAFRIAYASEKRDGYLSSNAGDSDLKNTRLKYRWQPTEDLDIVATWNHQTIGGNGVTNGVLTYSGYWEGYDPSKDPDINPDCTTCYTATMGDPAMFGHLDGEKYDQRDDPWDDGYPADKWPNNPFRHTTIDQYSADIDWNLGIGTLSLIPSYQKARFISQEPPRGDSWRGEDQKQETTQLDAQLTSPADASFEWIAGVYYYNTQYSKDQANVSINGSPPPGPPGSSPCVVGPDAEHTYCWSRDDHNEQTTYAAYANVSYPVLEDLRLNAGLRYTKDKRSTHSANDLPGTAAGPIGDWVLRDPSSGEWDDLTYRVGGQYDLTDQAMLYAMYATGYQPGTLSGGGQTDKQTVDQYTLGLKSRLLGNRLQVNVEGFHSKYYDQPMRGGMTTYTSNWETYNNTSNCGSGGGPDRVPTTFDNDLGYACYGVDHPTLPEVVSKGFDLEINWLIAENDRLDVSAEYLLSQQGKPEYLATQSELEGYGMSTALATEVLNGLEALATAYDGLTLQNSPEWTANISYSHIFDLPNGSTLTPKLNAEYRDSYWSQAGGPGGSVSVVQPGSSIQDAYTLWNVFLNWTTSDDRFNVSAYVKNIEDKPILTNFRDEAGTQYVSLNPPRTVGIVFSVKL